MNPARLHGDSVAADMFPHVDRFPARLVAFTLPELPRSFQASQAVASLCLFAAGHGGRGCGCSHQ